MTKKKTTKKTGTKKKVTAEEISEWHKQRTAGETLESIAGSAGRNVSVIYRHVEDIEGVRQRRGVTPEEIARARTMRAGGATLEAIAEELDRSGSAIAKWTSDIAKPRTPTQIQVSSVRYDRDQRKRDIESKTLTTNYPVRDDGAPPPYLPEKLPATADDFDTTGLFPDPKIITEASGVCGRWESDRARGIITFGVPIDVLKSLVILSTQFQPWSNDWWLSNRDRWGPIRTYARINSDTMSARTGLSPSSISRYESATRTPTKGDAEKMRMAYSAALVNRVWQLDMAICLYDFMVAHDLDPDDGETTYDGEQAIRWITAVGDDHEHEDEEVTLDHLPSLRHVRSLQPPPEYRDENESFMGFLGFATSVEEEGAEAEEAGAP